MTALRSRLREPKVLDAGSLQPGISSFRLHLPAAGKAASTVRTYTEAVAWFAAAYLRRQAGRTGWEQVGRQDLQEWMAWLLGRYSPAYASNQFRALQQFFKWLAAEDDVPDPMAGLKPPHVPGKPVPVFADGDLARLGCACAGRSFQQRRDATIIAVFTATGSGSQSWRACGMTRTIPAVVMWTCGSGRSPSAARAVRPGRSRSAARPRGAWTGTRGPGPGTPRPSGGSCGSGSATGVR
jgi:hypothetical protein